MFPNITGTGWKSKPLADALLEEAGVAVLSGTAFGAYGEGYLRFSIANSLDNIRKALDRVEAWVGKKSERREERAKSVAETVALHADRPVVQCGAMLDAGMDRKGKKSAMEEQKASACLQPATLVPALICCAAADMTWRYIPVRMRRRASLLLEKVRSGIDGLITTLRDKIDAEVFEAGEGNAEGRCAIRRWL